jgi:lysophospholipase L1-like esterase
MIEYIIIVILAILLPIASQIAFKRGIKKGSDDFFKLLVAFGFDSKVKAFQILNKQSTPGGIVFVGDSITQDYPISEWFKGLTVYNRGIGGDTTEGLLKRLDVSVHDLKPKTVVLLIGTNDFALLDSTPEQVAANIERIITLLRVNDPSIRIIIESIYPVNPKIDPFTVGKRTNEQIQKTNAIIKSKSDITFLDLYTLLSDLEGNLKKEYSHDGLHVNMDGYQIITNAIKQVL